MTNEEIIFSNYYRNYQTSIIYRLDEIFIDCYPMLGYDTTGYMVSNYGRLYNSIYKFMCSKSFYSNGYCRSKINGKDILLHRLVLQSFHPIENYNEMQVNHIDGNKCNNMLSNLEWVTRSENMIHAVNLGLMKTCDSDSKSIHTNSLVHSICKVLESGIKLNKDICNVLNIEYTAKINNLINNIKSKKEWKKISSSYNF